MTNWIITSSVLILIFVAARRLLKGHISPLLQYGLWLIVLARLIVPVNSIQSPISILNAIPAAPAAVVSETSDTTETIENTETTSALPAAVTTTPYTEVVISDAPENTASLPAQSSLPSLSFVLGTLWLTGMAGILIYAAIRNARLARFLHRTRRPFADGVYVAPALPSSCLFGMIRPTVYITEAVAADPQALQHVLAHEQAHRRHGDHIWNLLRIGVLALHWYNPLVWWACALSKRDAEMAADTSAIATLAPEERFSYGETLLNMLDCAAARDTWFSCSTTMITTKRALRERIEAIVKNAHTALSMAALVLLIAIAVVGCTFTGAEEEADSSTITPVVNPVSTYAEYTTYEIFSSRIIAQERMDFITYWLAENHEITHESAADTLNQWLGADEKLSSLIEESNLIQTSDGSYVGYFKYAPQYRKTLEQFLTGVGASLDMDVEEVYDPSGITDFFITTQENRTLYSYYFHNIQEEIIHELDPRASDPKYVEPILAHFKNEITGRELANVYAEWITTETDLTYTDTSETLLQWLNDADSNTKGLTDYYMLEFSDGSMLGYAKYGSFPRRDNEAGGVVNSVAESINFVSYTFTNNNTSELFFVITPNEEHILFEYQILYGFIRDLSFWVD